MSITDELRNWMESAFTYKSVDGDMFHKVNTPWFGWKQDIEEMLDRIDAEHESNVSYWQETSYKDGYDEGFASADDYFTDKRETLKEHGWVKLPVDADGEYIHIGDFLDGYGKIIEVVELRHGRSGWVLISRDGNGYADTFAFTHFRAPTVEDVLEEFAQMYIACNDKGTIAEYAKRLRLKEDA